VDIFLQQLINGLTLGSVYAIVALGYTMVYGIVQLINFAHGEVVMVGAMVALWVISALAGTALPPDFDRVGRPAVRRADVHGGRLYDGAHRLPALAHGSPARHR
jgi:ABC-type branched-subunit amino acid transport system permease subunit